MPSGGSTEPRAEDTRDKVDIDVLTEETRLYATIPSWICNSSVLPHYFTATVDNITTLDHIDDATEGEVDFTDLHERASDLRERIERVNAVVDKRAGDDVGLAAAAAVLQKEFANRLNPSLYMDRPAYEHEPALSHALLPSSESPRNCRTEPGVTDGSRRPASSVERTGSRRRCGRPRAASRILDTYNQTA